MDKGSPRLLTIKKASVYSGLPIWAIRQLIWGEKIPFIKMGKKYYLDIFDLETWIRNNKHNAKTEALVGDGLSSK